MKDVFIKSVLPTLLGVFAVVIVGTGCPTPIDEQDMKGPEIEILNPSEGAVFYTKGGVDNPKSILINAKATDDSQIVLGKVTVFNESGGQVHFHDERSSSQSGINNFELYTSFETDNPGTYTVEFEFGDYSFNKTKVTRTITCLESLGGGDDTDN